jgi:hypothetical protein
MAPDLDKIPAERRKELIKVGRRFGSGDTLAQAQQTLSALATHGVKLVLWGFNDADTQRLKDAHDMLIHAGVWSHLIVPRNNRMMDVPLTDSVKMAPSALHRPCSRASSAMA